MDRREVELYTSVEWQGGAVSAILECEVLGWRSLVLYTSVNRRELVLYTKQT